VNRRSVGKTKIGPYEVQTVFLGLDHSFGMGGPRALFETVILDHRTTTRGMTGRLCAKPTDYSRLRLPRHVAGTELAARLRRYGYERTRQTTSHMRLSSRLKGPEHHITIPATTRFGLARSTRSLRMLHPILKSRERNSSPISSGDSLVSARRIAPGHPF
jgi:hypothetical protein